MALLVYTRQRRSQLTFPDRHATYFHWASWSVDTFAADSVRRCQTVFYSNAPELLQYCIDHGMQLQAHASAGGQVRVVKARFKSAIRYLVIDCTEPEPALRFEPPKSPHSLQLPCPTPTTPTATAVRSYYNAPCCCAPCCVPRTATHCYRPGSAIAFSTFGSFGHFARAASSVACGGN